TLTDSREGITKSVQYGLKCVGIEEPDLKKLEVFIGPPLLDSFMGMYGLDEETSKKAIAFYRERFVPIGIYENKVFPGVPEMLKTLQEAGIHLAVASSKPQPFVHRVLQHFDIEKYFEVIVGSELDGRRGTKEEVVEEALRQLGVLDMSEEQRFGSCAMIGDRKFDIQGAKAYGLTGVGVRFGFAPEGELEAEGANKIAETVEELTELLLK
ncbi:MAG: HAD hydrolase-like protein, partial [Lachnospiraceae bacterium]|nr:HAD hydrolase-like protein [Lachnospiraceae bacterium]